MEIEIRQMKISDINGSLRLWERTKGLGIGNADSIDNLSNHIEKNYRHNFIAIHKDELIGTVLGGFDGRRGYIYHLAVDEHYRKNNIGRRLMEECFQSFKDINIEKCHMMVFKDNIQAIEFYDKIGCKLRDDVVVFSKDLNK